MRLFQVLNGLLFVGMLILIIDRDPARLIRELFDLDYQALLVVLAILTPAFNLLFVSTFDAREKESLIGLWVRVKKAELRKRLD